MSTDFTPGPWVVNAYRDFFQVTDEQGNEICYIDEIYDYNECDANARLIAAAPGMYALLEKLQAGHRKGNSTWQIIERMLAKARGEI